MSPLSARVELCLVILISCSFFGNLRAVTVVLDKSFGENERKEGRAVETQENLRTNG